MRVMLFTIGALVAGATGSQAAEASFLGSNVYATPAGCAKLAKLAAGAPRNLNSVPETLTAKGYETWEGGCTIDKITTTAAGKSWRVAVSCSEGADEGIKSTETWTRAADGSILVNAQGKKTRFVVCTAHTSKK